MSKLDNVKFESTYYMNRKNREYYYNYIHLVNRRPLKELSCKEIRITLR